MSSYYRRYDDKPEPKITTQALVPLINAVLQREPEGCCWRPFENPTSETLKDCRAVRWHAECDGLAYADLEPGAAGLAQMKRAHTLALEARERAALADMMSDFA